MLKEDGWFRSFRAEESVDAGGNPIPWITYSAIEFLKNRIHSEMSVFEYGCGGSTLWWASKVKEVVSVEPNKDWYKKISGKLPYNVNLYYIELASNGDYSKKITEFKNKFDIIFIDGEDRVNCIINSLYALKAEGVIVCDNSDRIEYRKGYNFLFEHGFSKIEFVGMCPIVTYKSETGIFYRPNNCLGI